MTTLPFSRHEKSVYDSIDCLPQVGPKRIEALNQLGIYTIYDLLTHFPFRYEDIQVKSLEEIADQDKVTLKGKIVTAPVVHHYGYKKSRLSFKLAIEDAIISVAFFNQPYLKTKVILEDEIAVFGKWDSLRQNLSGIKILGNSRNGEEKDFESVYHTNKSIRQGTLVTLIEQALLDYRDCIPEFLPEYLREKYHLIPFRDAVAAMHFPKTPEDSRQARRQIIYQEFFLYQLRLQLIQTARKEQHNGIQILYDVKKLKQFIATLPFELTGGQKQVVNEICRDLREPYEMNRLLQGDVGSGKTVVAVIAIMAAAQAGYQSAFMVPTEILAEQHYQTVSDLLAYTDCRAALLTGNTRPKERRELLEQLQRGEVDILIGTHALIQDDVQFQNLALVITDEQHRFGVNQRQKLNEKGQNPNVLYMTATPIPRTLAITQMGEMDVSVIDQLPSGRQPIETIWSRSSSLEKVFPFVEKELIRGQQAYVITPLIEKSETLDVKNAEEVYNQAVAFYKGRFQVGLLHGRMRNDEKNEIMKAFHENRIQVLVSTTVIEVGLNVPNATVMVIQDADRFGLAQLHQLRGRVGRGTEKSYCILLANPKSSNGKERMRIMTESTDGFYLSQKDLELRGSGDLFGIKQSGLPDFKVGDVIRDTAILEAAHRDAIQFALFLKAEEKKQYAPLLEMVEKQQQKTLRLQ